MCDDRRTMMRLYFVLLALAGAASALGTCKTALELCNVGAR